MIKILDRYILRGFLPMLLMTTLISWFIVLMQFLWRYVDELVGKGLGMWIVAQTVFYAAMTLLPLGLSLGVLFASLMYFGNMGERLELLAMKASGVPLYRIMRPLLVAILSLAVGLFVFQNTYMITSQVRMWTTLLSARKAAPELEIPEGTFYNGIPGYSVYVQERDKINTGRLKDIMIYDHNQGVANARIIKADSGRIVMDEGKTYLTWRLYNGQSFENLSTPAYSTDPRPTAYAKERFRYKEILINFDANFKLDDEEDMKGRFVGKNLSQLNLAIDTTSHSIDSIRTHTSEALLNIIDRERYSYTMPSRLDTMTWAVEQRKQMLGSTSMTYHVDLDSLLSTYTLQDSIELIGKATQKLQLMRSETEHRLYLDQGAYYEYRTNHQEWHRKFTLPVACIVFFFIGAPLGAIIRKGGLGMPVVISVLFFIVYYVIDTFGRNMILSQKMSVPLGMWLSTLVLLPIGIFLTYQATRDSASLNVDAYVLFFRRLLRLDRVRKVEYKEVSFAQIDYQAAAQEVSRLIGNIKAIMTSELFNSWVYSWGDYRAELKLLGSTSRDLDNLVELLSGSQETMLIAKLKDIPILPNKLSRLMPQGQWTLGIYLVLSGTILVPLGLYLTSRRNALEEDLERTERLLQDLLLEVNKQCITH